MKIDEPTAHTRIFDDQKPSQIPVGTAFLAAPFSIRGARSTLTEAAAVSCTDGFLRTLYVLADRVAMGDCSPMAPTDPYVPALEHTVPRIMDSLRV